MHSSEIRDICHKCGHHETTPVTGSPLSTDFCNYSHVDCGSIKTCDPSVRIPVKTKWDFEKTRRKNRRKKVKKEPDNKFPVPGDNHASE